MGHWLLVHDRTLVNELAVDSHPVPFCADVAKTDRWRRYGSFRSEDVTGVHRSTDDADDAHRFSGKLAFELFPINPRTTHPSIGCLREPLFFRDLFQLFSVFFFFTLFSPTAFVVCFCFCFCFCSLFLLLLLLLLLLFAFGLCFCICFCFLLLLFAFPSAFAFGFCLCFCFFFCLCWLSSYKVGW